MTLPEALALLGLPEGASEAQARAAYRRLARSAHPDAPGGSEGAFLALREALAAVLAAPRAPCPLCEGRRWIWKDPGASGSWIRTKVACPECSVVGVHG